MAGTIIDALVVTLGLDSSGFKKGQKDVSDGLDDTRNDAERTAKDMEAAGKRAASFFGSIRNEIIALAGVSLSLYGVKNFVTEMTNSLTQLGVSSKALDMTAKELDGFTGAAEAAGSSGEKIVGVLQNFQDLITDFRGGGDVFNNPLNKTLGGIEAIIGKRFDLKTMNSGDIFREIAEGWDKFSKDAQRKVGKDLNLDNATIQALSDGSFLKNQKYFENQSKASESAVSQTAKFNVQIVQLKRNFEAAGQTLFTAMLPYLEKIPPLLIKLGDWITEHGPEIEKFFSDSATEIQHVVDAVGGWENALKVLLAFVVGSWAIGMLGAIGRVAAAFGPVIAAMAVVSAWDKLGQADKEAEKQGISTGEYLVNKMLEKQKASQDSGNTPTDKILQWWRSLGFNDTDNTYDAYGTQKGNSQGGDSYGAYGTTTRGLRNNNPGNLNYVGQAGATKEGGPNGRFAVFETMQQGIAALYKQLQLYFSRGKDTIREIINTYAPSSENDTGAYISAIAKKLGKGADEILNSADTETIFNLMRGIIDHENGQSGKYISDTNILGGIQLGSQAMASRVTPSPMQGVSNKTDIHIGEMNMQTSATSVNALGADVERTVRRNALVSAYNTGQ
ncbi:hypothetical protein [Atlantibacter hermannii]|uniref:hypothetical protein n=1 Tax=Atlantibacter hermannii TaxID=565 RepID=UPI00289ADC2B|nr:hypothetical protein [Atlantibacter hermannii]